VDDHDRDGWVVPAFKAVEIGASRSRRRARCMGHRHERRHGRRWLM